MTQRALPFLGLLLLAACSKTTVTVELTDAPPDAASLEHVEITLSRVEVHVAGGDDDSSDDGADKHEDSGETADGGSDDGSAGWHTVAAPAGTFDLVALQNDVRATLGKLELPSGKITQIRLFIDPNGKNQVELTGGETCPLDLASVPPTGVKINHPFKALDVEDSSELKLVVDFDLKESLDQSGTCSFALKPVIKLKNVEKS
ncbi:MAG TPA: DUF4382 domain-containing protein [Polyangiaceae bacterium]|jgi:hypothetical protein|nr:DUF4382 domain-containing protein [Polyangiaceae bacterium]